MLGLIVIFFIGQRFYQLARAHEKSKWGFATLGIVSYYASTFIFGLLIGTTLEIVSPGTVAGMSDLVLGLMALPFGVLSTVGLFYLLKHIWEGNSKDVKQQMDPNEN